MAGSVGKSEADQAVSPSCADLYLLVWYVEHHSRPPQSLPVALEIGQSLLKASRTSGLPLYLLVAVAQEESSFNPEAINRASQDYGLFQVHYPFWQKFFKKREGANERRVSRADMMEVPANTQMAADILSYDLKLAKDDFVEMLGRYSGRTGKAQGLYVQHVFRFSLEFNAFERKKSEHCSSR